MVLAAYSLHVSLTFCASSTAESKANIWYQYNAFKPPPLAKAAVRSKAMVLLLMISTPIVGSYYCSMLLCDT